MTGRVQFYLNRNLETVEAPAATLTLLDYLRYRRGKTGTKEGCAEGDCGACTVVVGTREKEQIVYRAVNSCILFLPVLDGKEVITVEGLDQADGTLHPVQQALVDHHGSQCGFCTPGFVMSLYAHYLNDGPCDAASLNFALAGNLCRCTGYGPILAAGAAMHSYAKPRNAGTMADTRAKLDALKRDEMLVLEELGPAGARPTRFLAPSTIKELCAVMARYPDATLLSGGTDVGLWLTKQHRTFETIVYLGQVGALNTIDETERELRIGAGVSYSDALSVLRTNWPEFAALIDRLGAVQVRNCGTLGGNIANGSPIGDTLPALIALGAEISLRSANAERRIPVEDFFLGYQRQDRQPGEFLETIFIPRPDARDYFRCYKISKRFEQDISALCAAFNLRRERGTIGEARIAFGGMAETPKRARACEARLRGRPWTIETVREAAAALAQDFAPISDLRASATYRMEAAQNLLIKAYIEDKRDAPATRVFAAGVS